MMTMGVNWWMRSLTSHWMSLVKITGHNEKSNKFTKITDTVKFEFKITVVDKRFTSLIRGFWINDQALKNGDGLKLN